MVDEAKVSEETEQDTATFSQNDLYSDTISDSIDSFANGDYTDGEDSEQESDSKSGEEAGEEKKISDDSQLTQMEEEKADPTDEEKDSDKGDEESDKDSEKPDSEKSDKNDGGIKDELPKGKTVKAFHGKEKYDIPEEATVRVNIKGKGQVVKIQDLMDNYSGKVAYSEKFEDLTKKVESYETERKTYDQEKSFITGKIQNARAAIDDAMSKGQDPMTGINFLLDLMNYDVYDFNEKLEENMTNRLESYMQMDEVERENYKLSRRNQFLQDKQEATSRDFTAEKSQRELVTRIDGMRVAQGISEEQYVTSHSELTEEYGEGKFTPEQVVGHAAMIPHVVTAEELIAPYAERLGDDDLNELIQDFAVNLRSNKSTPESIKQLLAEEFNTGDYVAEINDKADLMGVKTSKAGVTTKQPKTDHIESFDDFDEDYNGSYY